MGKASDEELAAIKAAVSDLLGKYELRMGGDLITALCLWSEAATAGACSRWSLTMRSPRCSRRSLTCRCTRSRCRAATRPT